MHDGADPVFRDRTPQMIGIADVALDQGYVVGDGGTDAGREIVVDDNRNAGILQGQYRMGANIAGSARDQNDG